VSKETWPQLVDVCRKYIIMLFLCQNIAVFNDLISFFQVYSDILFNVWTYRSAKEQQSKSSAPVYLYQFSFEGQYPADISIPGNIFCLYWSPLLPLKYVYLEIIENICKNIH
jgi:hypothetical protein